MVTFVPQTPTDKLFLRKLQRVVDETELEQITVLALLAQIIGSASRRADRVLGGPAETISNGLMEFLVLNMHIGRARAEADEEDLI